MSTMTVEDVRQRVAEIAAEAGDDETAHEMEDRLHQDVLRAIAEQRCLETNACAAEALKTLDINFQRWCA